MTVDACAEGLQELLVTTVPLLHKLIAEGFSEKDCAEVGIVGASRQAMVEWHERTYVPPCESMLSETQWQASAAVDEAWAPQPEPDGVVYTAEAYTTQGPSTEMIDYYTGGTQGTEPDPIAGYSKAGSTTVTSINDAPRGGRSNNEDDEEAVDLLTCLERFGRLEKLEGESKYYCDRCKDFVAGTKQVGVWQPPDVLVLQLKRFKHQQSNFSATFSAKKMQTLVNFSTEEPLDLTPYVITPDPTDAPKPAGADEAEPDDDTAEQIAKLEQELGGTEATKDMLDGMGEDVSSLAAEIAEITKKLQELRGEADIGEGGGGDAAQYMYELFAVANHTGGTGGGHYCAWPTPHNIRWCLAPTFVAFKFLF